jgi:hypothetical protein
MARRAAVDDDVWGGGGQPDATWRAPQATEASGADPFSTSPGQPLDPLSEAVQASFQAPQAPANYDGYAQPSYQAAHAGGVLPGWDATKWGDTSHQSPKYVVGRILSQFPATTQGITAAVAEIQKAYPGSTWNGKDTVTIPGVGPVDILQGASQGGQAWQWGNLLDAAGTSTGFAGGGTGSGTVAGTVTPDTGDIAASLSPDVLAQLQQLLTMDPDNISITDSDLAPMSAAHDAALQRGRRLQQAGAAERASETGTLGTGGFDADVNRSYQEMGNQQAGFDAQLMNQKATERRAQLMQALQIGGGLMDADMERALREELTGLDNQLRRYSIDTQNKQYYDDLGFRSSAFDTGTNMELIRLLMGGL